MLAAAGTAEDYQIKSSSNLPCPYCGLGTEMGLISGLKSIFVPNPHSGADYLLPDLTIY
jgi:hypothetical protein